MITLSIADDRTEDADLIGDTLAAAGIEREASDLLVLLKSYAAVGTEPPCTLLSVLPLAPNGRKVLR
jgi:hypothetical protein